MPYKVIDSITGEVVELQDMPVDGLEVFLEQKLRSKEFVILNQVSVLELDTAVRVALEVSGPLYPSVDICRPAASKVFSEALEAFLGRFCALHEVALNAITPGRGVKVPGFLRVGHTLLFWRRNLYINPTSELLSEVITQLAVSAAQQ